VDYAGSTVPTVDGATGEVRPAQLFIAVPAPIVPDNPRSGVGKACRYDPDVNPGCRQWAGHYRTAVLPARPRKPRDKAKAEPGVLRGHGHPQYRTAP
jgi:transposase